MGPRRQRSGPATTGPPRTVPGPTSTTGSIPDLGDPRPVGELLAAWVGAKVEEVDDLVAEGRAKVAAIPDQRSLWLLAGEVLVRLAAVEQEVAQLRKAARR